MPAKKSKDSPLIKHGPLGFPSMSEKAFEEMKKRQQNHTSTVKKTMAVNDFLLDEIYTLAGLGWTHADIYRYYGMGHSAWYEWIDKNPQVREAVLRGSANMYALCCSRVRQKIDEGDSRMLVFYLSSRHKWGREDALLVEDEDTQFTPPKKIQKISERTKDPIEASKIYQSIMMPRSGKKK